MPVPTTWSMCDLSTVTSWLPRPTSSSGPTPESSTANSTGWPRSSSTRSVPLPRTHPTSWRRVPRASNRSPGWRLRSTIWPVSALATADDRDSRTDTDRSGDTSAALSTRFIEGVTGLDRVIIHGVPEADGRRVATFALSIEGMPAGRGRRPSQRDGPLCLVGALLRPQRHGASRLPRGGGSDSHRIRPLQHRGGSRSGLGGSRRAVMHRRVGPPDDGQPRGHPYTAPVKRISPIIILGAIAAILLMRRRDSDVVIPDSAWNPVDPS